MTELDAIGDSFNWLQYILIALAALLFFPFAASQAKEPWAWKVGVVGGVVGAAFAGVLALWSHYVWREEMRLYSSGNYNTVIGKLSFQRAGNGLIENFNVHEAEFSASSSHKNEAVTKFLKRNEGACIELRYIAAREYRPDAVAYLRRLPDEACVGLPSAGVARGKTQ